MGIENICNLQNCTGCAACKQICTHEAISMQLDEEGFLRPLINQDRCVECRICIKICPVNTQTIKHEPIKVFSGWSNNEETRLTSSSGGAFVEIAKLILAQNGVVFGVSMDSNMLAHHIFIESEKEIYKLQGSKYIQSIIGNAYKDAKQFLQEGRKVLFSGTPCQIAGLRNFLHKDYENLYTVDLICHGVPSPKVFKDYIHYIENAINEPVKEVKFRCKKSSWIFFNMGINPHVEKNGSTKYSYIGNYYSDPYIRAFLRDNILRPNCYQCQYTSLKRVGDFTIGDWWGYKATTEKDKDFDRKGVSLLFCNTEKAVAVSLRLNMYLKERTKKEALHTNLPLKKPFPMPKTRNEFWNEYRTKPFIDMVKCWMVPERITFSKYCRIYHRNNTLLYHFFSLYERIVKKIGLNKFVIYKYAK